MKPDSIRKFDLFYLGSIAVGLAGFALSYGAIMEQVDAQLTAEGLEGMGSGIVIASALLGVAISLALWFLISKLRIEFVKWILILFTVWSVFSLATGMAAAPMLNLVFSAISTALTIAALWFLFQPDAKAWFAEKRSSGDPG